MLPEGEFGSGSPAPGHDLDVGGRREVVDDSDRQQSMTLWPAYRNRIVGEAVPRALTRLRTQAVVELPKRYGYSSECRLVFGAFPCLPLISSQTLGDGRPRILRS